MAPSLTAVLAAFLLTFAPLVAAADAGRVIASAGDTSYVDGTGRHALAFGDSIDAGVTLQTGPDGRLQVRFTDGSLLSLRGDSEYKLDAYHYEGSQLEHQATLTRGALRTISGAIGHRAPERYRLQTALAIFGVRGTCYEVAVASDGVTYAAVCDGAIKATATGGQSVDLGMDDDYRFARFDLDGSIALLSERPEIFDRAARVERGHGADRKNADRDNAHRDNADHKNADRHDGEHQGPRDQRPGQLSGLQNPAHLAPPPPNLTSTPPINNLLPSPAGLPTAPPPGR